MSILCEPEKGSEGKDTKRVPKALQYQVGAFGRVDYILLFLPEEKEDHLSHLRSLTLQNISGMRSK
jgi:hypothetical protein